MHILWLSLKLAQVKYSEWVKATDKCSTRVFQQDAGTEGPEA